MESVSEQLPSAFNVAAYFLNNNLEEGNSQKVALFHRDNTYTYDQLRRFVQRTARSFLTLGLERENRIAILLPDTPELVFAFWGAIWMGAAPVPINTAYSVDEVQYIL